MIIRGSVAIGSRLQKLIDDERNSITEDNVRVVVRSQYEQSLEQLESFVFWSGSRRQIRALYAPQVAAISLAAAYLASDRTLPAEGGVPEAALIKMPTGTGKSGVIAVLARCLPNLRRILVLTPRAALSDQLHKDVSWRFWQHLLFAAADNQTFTADASVTGAELSAATIMAFLPSTAGDVLAAHSGPDKLIVIGTFQALEQIRRTAHDINGNNSAAALAGQLLKAIETFDLVIVDEGHYEPAPTWSRAVRDFKLPTILLSATPYRNDYKSFRVRGRFVFNYAFGDAVSDRTIRAVKFTCGDRTKIARGVGDAERFVDLLKKTVPSILSEARAYTDHPKVIVRADDFAKLKRLQNLITKEFGERPVLIHHQIKGSEPKKGRFHTVDLARDTANSDKMSFWLHESKLLEGIDDASFVAVALYDRFANARQLVQQVGRALRTTDKTRKTLQNAWVIAVPELHDLLEPSWSRYKDFEAYASKNPQRLVQAEGALPDQLLKLMPEVQYVNGEFRPCFASEIPHAASDFRVPASASVFEVSRSFDLAKIAGEVQEALLAEDRFKPQPIDNMPAGAMAFAYYGWRSSPYLSLQFFPEWTLGVCVLVHRGNYLLVNDTSGIAFDVMDLGMRRADRVAVARLMPESTAKQPVRVSRMGTFSLDVSERAIRSMSIRTRSLADTFGDLLEPVLVPTTTFGFVEGRGRYLGLTRGRVSDSYPEPITLPDYCQWAKARMAELGDAAATCNAVFDRYARVRDRMDKDKAAPKSILLDFDDTFAEFAKPDEDEPATAPTDIDYDELCSEVDDKGNFEITVDARKCPCRLTFNEATQRYSIESEKLDEVVRAKSIDVGRTDKPGTGPINRNQSFRIIVAEPGVVYAHKKFFEPGIEYRRKDGSVPLLDRVHEISALDHVVTEKGEKLFKRKRDEWAKKSVFGLLKSICEANSASDVSGGDRLFHDLRKFDTIVCEDDGEEIADFVAIDNRRKRIALIHAKVGNSNSGMSVRALQEVGRQVLASLAFCSAVAVQPKIKPGRWATQVNANGTKLSLSRIFRNTGASTVPAIESMAAVALADRSWNREIWILGGRLMNRERIERAIGSGNDSNRAQQFLMYLESLITGCARGNSTLQIYCN